MLLLLLCIISYHDIYHSVAGTTLDIISYHGWVHFIQQQQYCCIKRGTDCCILFFASQVRQQASSSPKRRVLVVYTLCTLLWQKCRTEMFRKHLSCVQQYNTPLYESHARRECRRRYPYHLSQGLRKISGMI